MIDEDLWINFAVMVLVFTAIGMALGYVCGFLDGKDSVKKRS